MGRRGQGEENPDGWRLPLLAAVVIGVVVLAGVAFHAAGGSKTKKGPAHRPGAAAKASGAAKVTAKTSGATAEQGDELEEPVPERKLERLPVLEVRLQGEPKSGTTWMELVVKGIVRKYKELGLCGECSFEGKARSRLRGANIAHGSHIFTDLAVIFQKKHQLPLANGQYARTAGRLASKIPSAAMKDCIAFYVDNGWRADLQCPTMKPPGYRPDARYVNIVRDPRALLVSGSHYFRKPLDRYIKKAAEGVIKRTALRYHWFDKRMSKKSALVLHYRAMKNNPLFEYQRIAVFLGLPLSKTHVGEVVSMTSVEAMRNMEVHHKLPRKNAPGKDTAKVRSGTVDEFRNEIKGKQLTRVNQLMADIMPEELVLEFFNDDDLKLVKMPKPKNKNKR